MAFWGCFQFRGPRDLQTFNDDAQLTFYPNFFLRTPNLSPALLTETSRGPQVISTDFPILPAYDRGLCRMVDFCISVLRRTR